MPTMIHDFVLTEHYIVLLACPAVFDQSSGHPALQWQPAIGRRIGLISLDGGSTTWLEADPFFVFQFANAFERGGKVVVDYVRHGALNIGYAPPDHRVPTLHRMEIDLGSRRITDAQVAEMVVEFPRVNDAFDAQPTRFVYLPTRTDTLLVPDPPSATFNTMMKVNTATGDVVRHDLGNRIAGEATFIPRGSSEGEDDGYLAFFSFDPEKLTSDLVLLDAQHVDGDAVAVIRMPQRVPQGLHGTWVPKV